MELFLIGNKGIYMENDSPKVKEEDSSAALEAINKTSDGDELEDDDNFMQLLENLGGQNTSKKSVGDSFRNVCLLSEKSVKVLWDHFRQEAPDAGFQFEKFLSNISDSIHTKEKEKVNMEMKRLYEEMERQIEEEKELVIRMVGDIKEEPLEPREAWNERMKESQLRNEMREEIAQKDLLLTQLQTRAKELQETLSRVQENETTSKHDVALLLKEKRMLESKLEIQTSTAEELRSALEKLRRESVNERRQRAMSALNVAENIAVEREGRYQVM
ncbi:hypothetical protein DAPPUDRAFT_251840 [Daphnia pulex]|uniref:Uncharacterized protein n=1 Tax=Daphnia pulex TaxID=6669 RepID=E9H1H0_DAPPU|nr:hypothetical protein DAPPUDRAFT_251840 [Daphnia pulex]|eukprot:EFX74348.1 hypothetical protein DAPPUDRAFT_251840 [Daphnia pulex]